MKRKFSRSAALQRRAHSMLRRCSNYKEEQDENIVFSSGKGLVGQTGICRLLQRCSIRARSNQSSGTAAKAERPSAARSGIEYHISWREGEAIKYKPVLVWRNGGSVNLNLTFPWCRSPISGNRAIQAPRSRWLRSRMWQFAWTSWEPSYGRSSRSGSGTARETGHLCD